VDNAGFDSMLRCKDRERPAAYYSLKRRRKGMSRKTPEPAAARRSKSPSPAAVKNPASHAAPTEVRPSQVQKPDGSNFIPRPTAAASGQTAGNHIPEDRIAARAYLKWLARGSPIGDDKRDWFEAQEEVLREQHAR
jgi:uncharacterized membrane protein